MYMELFDQSTGAKWVYRLLISIVYENRFFSILQKVNLDDKAELFEVIEADGKIEEGDAIQPVLDQELWKELMVHYKSMTA